tara:strand:+ start:343 stop:852 length:510 start_codon:yes stop_codon:yes gene_type:complete
MVTKKKNLIYNFLKLAPLVLLYISVLNDFDFNFIKYFSFNFPFILIYYWSLKKSDSLGYGYIFIAGLINDVVVGFPVGFTSINYLLICGFAAYLRNITLRPRLIQDWFFFFFTILVVNSLGYIILSSLLSITVDYVALFYNTFFTFMFYLVFANLFQIYQKAIFKESND